jgi:hypothetical protein
MGKNASRRALREEQIADLDAKAREPVSDRCCLICSLYKAIPAGAPAFAICYRLSAIAYARSATAQV